MLKLKKNVLMILMVMLVIIAIIIPTNVFATDGSFSVVPGGTTSPTPTTVTSPTPRVTPTPGIQNNLPQTGIGDYTGLIVITILLGASSIFAYKKIKEYNKYQ